jgi:hypothetical protein
MSEPRVLSKALDELRRQLTALRGLLVRRWPLVLGAAGGLSVAGAASFGPVVRWQARAQAEQRGLALEIDAVRPAWAGVWLRGVRVAPIGVEGIEAELGSVRVRFGLGLSPRELAIRGGTVRLTGGWEELSKRLGEWRKGAGTGSAGVSGTRVRLSTDGIDVVWRGLGAEPVYLWGARFERAEDGSEQAGADRLRAPLGPLRVESRNMAVAARKMGQRRVLERVAADGVELVLRVGAEQSGVRAQATNDRKPSSAKAASDGSQDEPRFVPDPARGPKLRALIGVAAAALRDGLPEGGALTLSGLRVKVIRAGEMLTIGPSELRVERSGDAAHIALAPGARADRGATPLGLQAHVPFGAEAVGFELEGGPVSLASLGIQERSFGLSHVQDATVEAHARATLSADGSALSFAGSGKVDRLSLARPELAPEPLSGIGLSFSIKGAATLDGGRIHVEQGELGVGDVRARAELDLERDPEGSRLRAKGGVPLASCQALLDALPRGFAPRLSMVRMSGTLALDGELDFDSRKPGDTKVRLAVKNECRVSDLPPELSPRRFSSPFTREVKGADGAPMLIDGGPGTPTWIPYDGISPYMETALLVCEDGRFPHHRGFDFRAIENSIRDNLKAGRFARGASTLSMQLAKNLYLGTEKTLSRKVQEAVFTILLEQELSKIDLMELYLNVVEFGPGLYGIGPAAHYYFAKHPRDLSLGQALFLGSILPNPDAQHFRPDGQLNPGWSNYLRRLMKIAYERKRISDHELEAGLSEQVAFRVPGETFAHPPPPPGAFDHEPSELDDVPPRGALGRRGRAEF